MDIPQLSLKKRDLTRHCLVVGSRNCFWYCRLPGNSGLRSPCCRVACVQLNVQFLQIMHIFITTTSIQSCSIYNTFTIQTTQCSVDIETRAYQAVQDPYYLSENLRYPDKGTYLWRRLHQCSFTRNGFASASFECQWLFRDTKAVNN